jgi:hypothetical protein
MYYKCELRSVLQNARYALCHDRPIITDRTVRNCRLDRVTLDKAIKQVHSIDVAMPNSHSLHSTLTEKLENYKALQEEPSRVWQLSAVCTVQCHSATVHSATTGINPEQTTRLSLRRAEGTNTYHMPYI